jgi:hypothetical protein
MGEHNISTDLCLLQSVSYMIILNNKNIQYQSYIFTRTNYINDPPHLILYIHLTSLFNMECTGHMTQGWRMKGHYRI